MTRSFRWLDDARADVTYAVRSLGRNPGFAVAAIFTLALGIGAATAISSVVDTVMLQPLPFPGGNRLVTLTEPGREPRGRGPNYQEYLAWRQRTRTLSGLASSGWHPQIAVTTPNGTARMSVGIVSPNYFEVLGTRALLGRTIVSSDERNPQVAMLTFETWQRHYGSDPAILGKTLDARPSGSDETRYLTIVGVLPEHHETLGSTVDYYMAVEPVTSAGRPSGAGNLIGRLREDVSLAAANEEANAIGTAIRPPRSASAAPLTGPRFAVDSVKDGMVATLKPALRIFLAAVAVLLIIVCANVANLLLARGTARQREIAVRLALGASRGRIVRQILTECLVLVITGLCVRRGAGWRDGQSNSSRRSNRKAYSGSCWAEASCRACRKSASTLVSSRSRSDSRRSPACSSDYFRRCTSPPPTRSAPSARAAAARRAPKRGHARC